MDRHAPFDDELPRVPAHLQSLVAEMGVEQECEACYTRAVPLYSLGARGCTQHLDARNCDAAGERRTDARDTGLYGCCGRAERAPCMPAFHVFPSVPRIGNLALVLPAELVRELPDVARHANEQARAITYGELDTELRIGFSYRESGSARTIKRGLVLSTPRDVLDALGIAPPPLESRMDEYTSIFARAGIERTLQINQARVLAYVLPVHGPVSISAQLFENTA